MNKGIWEEFDGYQEIAAEIEASRKYGQEHALEKDSSHEYLRRLHPPGLKLKVIDIVEETPSTTTLRLASADGWLPPFQAGQFIALYLNIGPIRTSRPYSLSSPPNQTGHYEVTIRRVPGGLVSNYLLDEVKIGTILESSAPAGQFVYNPLIHNRHLVYLAGGSGITPFMSMVREIIERGLDRTVTLFYGSRTLGEAVFHQTLSTMAQRYPNIRYIPVIEYPEEGYPGKRGYITASLIKEVLGDLGTPTFFLCGPQAMYDFCLGELDKLNVPKRQIRREAYGAPADIVKYPGWPEGIKATDTFQVNIQGAESLTAPAGQTLLTTLEKSGLVVPALCRSGECSLCRLRVIKGRVFQPAGALVRKSDRLYGYVHSCVSYPLEDLTVSI